MKVLPETLEELASRIDALERRVHDLEQASASTAPSTAQPQSATVFADTPDLPNGEQVTSAFFVLGKSLLGIAGAYVLRALAESGVLPRLLIAAVAVAYAVGWLVAASRARRKTRFAAALFAATSALILAPMLWELIMRFHVLPPAASAAVLALFVAAATALSWREQNAPDFTVAYAAAAITALSLSIFTHEMIAFLVLLLAMLAVCEYRCMQSGLKGICIPVALLTDCAAWMLIVVYHTPPNTRADYPDLGAPALALPASLLFLISVAGIVFRTARLRRKITIFEAAQSVIAFLLWILTGMYLVHWNGRAVGMVCLLFAAACYATAFKLFRRAPEPRNFHVFTLWSAGLLLAGVFLTLPAEWAVANLALAAAASAALAVRIGCTTLESHAIVYLAVAAFASGLVEYAFRALAGNIPETVAWSLFLVAACAVLVYGLERVRDGEPWQFRLLRLIPALLAVCAIAALSAHGAVSLVAREITLAAFHVAFVRTLILCAMALALAFAGSRWRRLELKRIAYAILALIAAKLVFEDMRHGHMGFTAASIFLFALTLIGVPRLARAREAGEHLT